MRYSMNYLLRNQIYLSLLPSQRYWSHKNKGISTNFLRLKERGLFSDIFPNQPQKMLDLTNQGPQTVYAGFDPTADSLHIGNLLVLINLMHWQRCGHNAIAVLGGATGLIGDPSGKLSERPEANRLVVERNLESHRNIINNIFYNFHKYYCKEFTPSQIEIVNNMDWYKQLNCLELVTKIGRHFRMGTMLGRQSVKDRLNSEDGMSFTEFTYQIFQAYDWLYLLNNHKCNFQIGGHDQMGNMVSGYELIKRMTDKDVYGLTLPLIVSDEGDKFGKTAGNAVWLSKSKSTPFQFYQFFVRVKDTEVEKMLRLFTFLPLNEIEDLVAKHMKEPEKRLAQVKLAELVTVLVHGAQGLEKAKEISSILYERDIRKLEKLECSELSDVFKDSTTVELLSQPGFTMLDLAMKAKCFANEGDAIRIITAGGFYINYQKVSNISEVLTSSVHVLANNITLVRVGKKNYTIVKWL